MDNSCFLRNKAVVIINDLAVQNKSHTLINSHWNISSLMTCSPLRK